MKKSKGFELQLSQSQESYRQLDNSKRSLEQKLSDKDIYVDKISKEKDLILQNMKSLERSNEEKSMQLKRFERSNNELSEDLKNIKEKYENLYKLQENMVKEKENDMKEFEKTMKEFDILKVKYEEILKKNVELDSNFQQSLSIFKQNCEVLRVENISLSEKLKDRNEDITSLQTELLEFQKKTSNHMILVSENDDLKSREIRLLNRNKELEIEYNKRNEEFLRKNEENNSLLENFKKNEEVKQDYERKLMRIKHNYQRALTKINRLFNKLKEDRQALTYKVQSLLSDHLKEAIRLISVNISRFITNFNENSVNEKRILEETIIKKFEDNIINLKHKHEEVEKAKQESSEIEKQDYFEKLKVLQMEINETRQRLIVLESENKNLEIDRKSIEAELKSTLVENKSIESEKKSIENDKKSLQNYIKTFETEKKTTDEKDNEIKILIIEMKERFTDAILSLKKTYKKREKYIRDRLMELFKNVKIFQEEKIEGLTELRSYIITSFDKEILENMMKTDKFNEETRLLEEKSLENEALMENLRVFRLEIGELQGRILQLEEEKEVFQEQYERFIKDIENKVLIETNGLRKEIDKLRYTNKELENEVENKQNEVKSLKTENSRLIDRSEGLKEKLILKENDRNFQEIQQKIIKKRPEKDVQITKNDGKMEVLESKIRELQQINKNIFEHRRTETERSFLKSPGKLQRNSNSISIDLKD